MHADLVVSIKGLATVEEAAAILSASWMVYKRLRNEQGLATLPPGVGGDAGELLPGTLILS